MEDGRKPGESQEGEYSPLSQQPGQFQLKRVPPRAGGRLGQVGNGEPDQDEAGHGGDEPPDADRGEPGAFDQGGGDGAAEDGGDPHGSEPETHDGSGAIAGEGLDDVALKSGVAPAPAEAEDGEHDEEGRDGGGEERAGQDHAGGESYEVGAAVADGVGDNAADHGAHGGPKDGHAQQGGGESGIATDFAYDVHGQQDADGLEAQAEDAEGGEPGGDAAGKAGVGEVFRRGRELRQGRCS